MTPMIDVVFLLLIFFLCTASFQIAEDLLPTNLLASGGSSDEVEVEPDPHLERVVVELHSPGPDGMIAWVVNDEPYTSLAQVRAVLQAVARIDPSLPVILDVEGAVALGHVIDVYDLCRLVGFDKIQFAASVDV